MTNHPTENLRRTGRVVSINRSEGGIPKSPVPEALITVEGIAGDQHRNPNIHGGPDRAVVLFSLEVIEALVREGHSIGIGSVGENLTVAGLDWSLIVPGSELLIGEATRNVREPVRLQVTKYTKPCFKVKGFFLNGDETRILHELNPGWNRVCARVLAEGVVRTGDPITLL